MINTNFNDTLEFVLTLCFNSHESTWLEPILWKNVRDICTGWGDKKYVQKCGGKISLKRKFSVGSVVISVKETERQCSASATRFM
jgi:hypothetical protein